ncbi:YaaA family protein [Romboutsia sp. Marseille-P6047]|uniref:YaaA family protein n=1 Tax=Romboutsia sp. Marseille-P6047 TaxID=2161817 RepID=UPI000F05F794|nr:YaaA family protein [Romboutsia sp. Marseille-P6047]
MITIISPTTTMKFDKNISLNKSSIPYFIDEANYLIRLLKNLDIYQVQNLMNLSEDLSKLNLIRYENYGLDSNVRLQSILAFNGEVFNCMNVSNFTEDDFDFATDHFKILSGLYGVLSPCDVIEPYRLEMKSKLENKEGKNLYKFWKDKITDFIIKELSTHNNKTLLNLASSEYVKAIDIKELNKTCKFVNVEFKDFNEKNNKYKVIGMYSKQARGHMSKFIIKNKIDNIMDLKSFDLMGYKFNNELSSDCELIFTR